LKVVHCRGFWIRQDILDQVGYVYIYVSQCVLELCGIMLLPSEFNLKVMSQSTAVNGEIYTPCRQKCKPKVFFCSNFQICSQILIKFDLWLQHSMLNNNPLHPMCVIVYTLYLVML